MQPTQIITTCNSIRVHYKCLCWINPSIPNTLLIRQKHGNKIPNFFNKQNSSRCFVTKTQADPLKGLRPVSLLTREGKMV